MTMAGIALIDLTLALVVACRLWRASYGVGAPGALASGFRDGGAHELEPGDQLAHRTDGLTGLANRVLFTERLSAALSAARSASTPVAVVLCDLDHFKVLNDSLGHDVGDGIVAEVGRRIVRAVGGRSAVARMGGDEFAVLGNDGQVVSAMALAQRIQSCLEEPISVDRQSVSVTTSIGLAVSTGPESADQLLREADTALYLAKEQGRNRIVRFDADMAVRAVRRLDLEIGLRAALADGDLHTLFQPVIDLRTGCVTGAEGLLRWVDPVDGVMPLEEVIPIAEETGLIHPVGRHVLGQALDAAAAWCAAGLDLHIAVNASARQFGAEDFVPLLLHALHDRNLPADHLVLEVTESALADAPASAADDLQYLRALGVRIAIDDFGMGWSSMGRLKAFPADILKIDRDFVAGLGHDATDQAIVGGILQLARSLGLDCIAEGVENVEQLEALQALGCEYAQGFLLCRPTSVDRVGQLAVTGARHLLGRDP